MPNLSNMQTPNTGCLTLTPPSYLRRYPDDIFHSPPRFLLLFFTFHFNPANIFTLDFHLKLHKLLTALFTTSSKLSTLLLSLQPNKADRNQDHKAVVVEPLLVDKDVQIE